MRAVTEGVVAIVVLATVVLVYQQYAATLYNALFGVSGSYNIYVGHVAVSATVADTLPAQQQGLSGVTSLPPLAGKLFIFNQAGPQGMWMKDMQFPLDILWFDNQLKLVHIEQNVDPSSYPTIYSSDVPARFVLEVNAGFVKAYNINLGQSLTLPTVLLPADVRQSLQ